MSTLFTDFFTKINQISPLEHKYTEVLEAIALKPKTLYFRGKLPENMSKTKKQGQIKSVAIVGSRHNTKYGEEVAYKLAYELAKKGVIIVSGLAYGIDSIAHRGCLAANGRTVAILGTPIDRIYPTAHRPLAREIIEKNGAILSEYAPDTKVFTRTSFLERNRLISGLSDIVVVVEAAEKSGSLNTATHALAQGKTVFAVPGNITNPYSQGCNKLIKQGAFPYTEPDDILRELFPEEYTKKQKQLKIQDLIGDTDVETIILQAIANGLRSGEDIMKASKLPPEVFSQTITLLEIKSRVRSLGMNKWSLL
ncbi:DNA-processing protein DprA [Candidatus Saccharibacteria bacterium]|nr:DNA-processing protein DprA [Candidatus Saccharibacteria bacterium]